MSPTKKPLSPKQLAANRANAVKSHGPKTAEGKARSSRNAVKHGLAGITAANPQDLAEFARIEASLVHLYRPVNDAELFAIERMALAHQAMRRGSRLESGLFSACMSESLDVPDFTAESNGESTRAQDRNHRLALGFQNQVRQSGVWTLLLRYKAQTERHYRRALEEFDRLKALRGELPNRVSPNDPISALQPKEETGTYAATKTAPPPIAHPLQGAPSAFTEPPAYIHGPIPPSNPSGVASTRSLLVA